MQRITMSLDETLANEFDKLLKRRGYTSRSEAMRDLVRHELEVDRLTQEPKSYCIANLSYVYNHHIRNLAERLTESQHQHHDLVVSTMHVHLDHQHCLETVVLKGPTVDVRAYADSIQAERGVRHVNVNLVSVATNDTHGMAYRHTHRGHMHLIPRS
jgi:CopG family nickel-responsive transcriptional regulator